MEGTGPGGRVLLILLLAYIFNFIDRQIIGVLALPIKAELGLSDKQLGLMGGIAFALFYSGLAIPIAWLADRRSRVRIIAWSVGLWSLTTAACGLIGRRFTGRPVAARTAEAIAAGEVTTGTALAAFAPNGATTSRSSTSLTIRMSGASSAVGSA